jgi:hypothetical protein
MPLAFIEVKKPNNHDPQPPGHPYPGSPGFTYTVRLLVKTTMPGFAPEGFFTNFTRV